MIRLIDTNDVLAYVKVVNGMWLDMDYSDINQIFVAKAIRRLRESIREGSKFTFIYGICLRWVWVFFNGKNKNKEYIPYISLSLLQLGVV